MFVFRCPSLNVGQDNSDTGQPETCNCYIDLAHGWQGSPIGQVLSAGIPKRLVMDNFKKFLIFVFQVFF